MSAPEEQQREERRQTRNGCGFVVAIVVVAVSATVLIVGRSGDDQPQPASVKSSPASCEMLRADMMGILSEFSDEAGIPIEPLLVERKTQTVRVISLDGTDGVIHHREILPSGVVVGGMSCYGKVIVEFPNGERTEASVTYDWTGRPKGIQMYAFNESPHRGGEVMIHALLRLVPEGVE